MSLKVLDEAGGLSAAPRDLPVRLFEQFDRADDDQIIAELQGGVIEQYAYRFSSGGQTVTGLSLAGVMAVAQSLGGITCSPPIWSQTEDEITCDISATDHARGLTVWGTASEPLYDKHGNRDRFARSKALSKSQRNAIRKVIPETVATQMLKQYLAGQATDARRPIHRAAAGPVMQRDVGPRSAAPDDEDDDEPPIDLGGVKRRFLSDLAAMQERRDLAPLRSRIEAAGLWDDADVAPAFRAAYERLGGRRRPRPAAEQTELID